MPPPSASDALTPPPASVARFRGDFARLVGTAAEADHPLGIAVSGGGDSVALLLLAAAAFPGAVRAATVDHQLRLDAAAEAEMVSRLCSALSIEHVTLRAQDEAPLSERNVQAWARELRYRALARWAGERGIPWVAVAHHADDVAENLLMRARRGAGLRGLARMAESRPISAGSPVLLVRPLLDWRREELAGIVENAGVAAAIDPSNADDRFDRARIRKLLRATTDLPVDRLAASAAYLRDADDAIRWVMAREAGERLERDEGGDLSLDPTGLPRELRRRFVAQAIEEVRARVGLSGAWREDGVDRLLTLMDAGRGGTLAGVQARARKKRWHFRPEPPRR